MSCQEREPVSGGRGAMGTSSAHTVSLILIVSIGIMAVSMHGASGADAAVRWPV
ncbi:MAG: hypothetical protein IH877_04750 [Gemmatimonadetes bacterium]|nr:hypothetical protein [Gemmatimonadota bacterium]